MVAFLVCCQSDTKVPVTQSRHAHAGGARFSYLVKRDELTLEVGVMTGIAYP